MQDNTKLEDNDMIHCPICFEVFTQPRSLPCLHTFCEACLVETLSRKPLCPCCKTDVFISGNVKVQTFVSKLPINFMINKLIDKARSEQMLLVGESKYRCDLCVDHKAPAKVACKACAELMCAFHADAHQRTTGTKDHEFAQADMIEEIRQQRELNRCKEHPKEDVRLYCEKCSIPICRECSCTDHLGHKMNLLSLEKQRRCESLTALFRTFDNKRMELLASCEERFLQTVLLHDRVSQLAAELKEMTQSRGVLDRCERFSQISKSITKAWFATDPTNVDFPKLLEVEANLRRCTELLESFATTTADFVGLEVLLSSLDLKKCCNEVNAAIKELMGDGNEASRLIFVSLRELAHPWQTQFTLLLDEESSYHTIRTTLGKMLGEKPSNILFTKHSRTKCKPYPRAEKDANKPSLMEMLEHSKECPRILYYEVL